MIDTSAWIHFSNSGIHPLSTYIQDKLIHHPELLFTCPPIIQEYLQGVREDKDFEDALQMFHDINILNADALVCSIEAAQLYRILRKKGITIRKPNDCLIAWYAIQFELTLVHDDIDFDLIALHSPLKVLSHP